jgi:hypothetical protein
VRSGERSERDQKVEELPSSDRGPAWPALVPPAACGAASEASATRKGEEVPSPRDQKVDRSVKLDGRPPRHYIPRPSGAPAKKEIPVAKHPFLSDEWFAIVEKLVEEHGADAPAHTNVVVNLVITGTPFGDERQMHMGARDGKGHWGIGHADDADVTLTTDYGTAKEVFVSGNPQAGMQAFMAGKVKVQGDMAKLMASQQGGGNAALNEAIQGVTE